MEDIVDAALDGIDGRAGLILCGLYGEDPALLESMVDIGARRSGVVGIDLAGGPAAAHQWQMEDYAGAFSAARDRGLGRTVHAGEGRPPREIALAINVLHAQRIGHGTTLLDDPAVADLVAERGVTIEACPTARCTWRGSRFPSRGALSSSRSMMTPPYRSSDAAPTSTILGRARLEATSTMCDPS